SYGLALGGAGGHHRHGVTADLSAPVGAPRRPVPVERRVLHDQRLCQRDPVRDHRDGHLFEQMNRALRTHFILWLLCAAARTAFAQSDPSQTAQAAEEDSHQYAHLREAQVEIKDFSFPAADDGKINLREMARGKKLVLIHYFAAWCHNSNFDVAT